MAQPDYSLPPWEQGGANPAEYYLKGLQIGGSIQEARNRLNLQAQTTALETSVKQQQAQQSAMLEQEQLEQQHAYKTAALGLQQQELQQAQEKINLQTQQAAQSFLAQKAYQGEVARLMQENPQMDEGTASMTAWLRVAPLMKGGGAGVAGIGKALAEQAKVPAGIGQPQFFRDPTTGANFVMGPKGHILRSDTNQRGIGAQATFDRMDYAQLQKELSGLQKEQMDPMANFDKKASAQRAARIQAIQGQLQRIRSGAGMAGTTTQTTTGEEEGEDFTQPTQPSARGSNIKSIRPMGATSTATAPTATAPTGAAAAEQINIPGLGGLRTASRPVNTRSAQIAAKQARETAAAKVAQAKELYEQLQKANTGKGTYMSVDEWNSKLTDLNAMLKNLPPEDRSKITGEEVKSGYDTEGQ